MTLLSNAELEEEIFKNKIVWGPGYPHHRTARITNLEAASIRLTVGEIIVVRHEETNDGRRNIALEEIKEGNHILAPGDVCFVVTREEMNFHSQIAGIMTPKSSGVAERGILITNTGHVDPGYKGKLKYAVMNMGINEFPLYIGQSITKLMIFKLSSPANPDWQKLHGMDERSFNNSAVLHLGEELLNIRMRTQRIVHELFMELVFKYGIIGALATLFITFVASYLSLMLAAHGK